MTRIPVIQKSQDMVLFTDLHLESSYKFGGEAFWLDLGMTTIELAHTLAVENGNVPIVFLGDLFEVKDRHPGWIINKVREKIRWSAEQGIEWFFLIGNHDIGDRAAVIMESLNDIDNVTVVKKPSVAKVGNALCTFIPYLESTEETADWAEELCNEANVLFLHHGLEGAVTGLGYVFPEGLDTKTIGEYRYVFCGHYHNHQQIFGNAYYLGSPYQLDFGERDDDLKGVWFFNNDKGTLTQYRVPGAPEFLHFDVEDVSSFDVKALRDDFKNCFVKIVLSVTRGERATVDIREIKAQVKKMGALSVVVNTKLKEEKSERMDVGTNFKWSTVIEKWAEQKKLKKESLEEGLDIYRTIKEKRLGR